MDAVYMSATQAMTGQGGWPMTVFATPEGHPFYCGTYFPRPQFQRLLHGRVAGLDRRPGRRVLEQGAKVVEALDRARSALPSGPLPTAETLDARPCATCAESFDPVRGGFGGAPKFPPSMVLEFLLRHPASATPWRMAERRSRRWRAAACTTSSAAASPATPSTPAGSCRTSRRCSTTTRCCCGSTRTGGARPASAAGPPGRPGDAPTGCCARCARPRAGSPPRWTPTARARRAGSTSGRPSSCARSSARTTAPGPPSCSR